MTDRTGRLYTPNIGRKFKNEKNSAKIENLTAVGYTCGSANERRRQRRRIQVINFEQVPSAALAQYLHEVVTAIRARAHKKLLCLRVKRRVDRPRHRTNVQPRDSNTSARRYTHTTPVRRSKQAKYTLPYNVCTERTSLPVDLLGPRRHFQYKIIFRNRAGF